MRKIISITISLLLFTLLFYNKTYAQLSLYSIPKADLYPLFYTDQSIQVIQGLKDLPKKLEDNKNQIVGFVFPTEKISSMGGLVNPRVNYKRINDSMYQVTIGPRSTSTVLVFNQNFHSLWQIKKAATNSSCVAKNTYSRFKATECFTNINSLATLTALFPPPASHILHFPINGSMNAWLIPASSKTETYMIVFQQRNYFLISLGVSLICIFAFLIILVR